MLIEGEKKKNKKKKKKKGELGARPRRALHKPPGRTGEKGAKEGGKREAILCAVSYLPKEKGKKEKIRGEGKKEKREASLASRNWPIFFQAPNRKRGEKKKNQEKKENRAVALAEFEWAKGGKKGPRILLSPGRQKKKRGKRKRKATPRRQLAFPHPTTEQRRKRKGKKKKKNREKGEKKRKGGKPLSRCKLHALARRGRGKKKKKKKKKRKPPMSQLFYSRSKKENNLPLGRKKGKGKKKDLKKRREEGSSLSFSTAPVTPLMLSAGKRKEKEKPGFRAPSRGRGKKKKEERDGPQAPKAIDVFLRNRTGGKKKGLGKKRKKKKKKEKNNQGLT